MQHRSLFCAFICMSMLWMASISAQTTAHTTAIVIETTRLSASMTINKRRIRNHLVRHNARSLHAHTTSPHCTSTKKCHHSKKRTCRKHRNYTKRNNKAKKYTRQRQFDVGMHLMGDRMAKSLSRLDWSTAMPVSRWTRLVVRKDGKTTCKVLANASALLASVY